MRADIGGTDMPDDAAWLLPPPPEEHPDPTDQLWHTATFAAITPTPAPRRKLTAGLTALGLTTVAVCGFAGVKLAAVAGLTPPSPPRYVITDQPQAVSQASAHTPPGAPVPEPAAPPPPVVVPAPPPVMNSSVVSRVADPDDYTTAQRSRRKHKHSG